MNEHYDYIVVGAGSAGCPLASRLSDDPSISVLLIESGPSDNNLFVQMPRGIGKVFNPGNKHIWEYQVNTGGNWSAERWFRGKTLGGSSSVNGMVYMRGAPRDYDEWAGMGCEGWGWADIGKKFVELENHDLGAAEWRGVGGPQNITTHPKGEPLYEAILNAAAEMGIARVEDVNDLTSVREGGMGYQPSTCYRGQRFNASRAFLEPARNRKNLDVVTNTDVLKVEFEGKRATGVSLRRDGQVRSIRAKREIILSAGAIQTPKLLQLSGIGPGSLLKPLGIDVVADSPWVGRNLREHRHVDLHLKVTSGSQNPVLGGPGAIWAVLRYLFGRTGPMTHAAHEVGGFAKTDPSLDHADIQFGLMTAAAGVGEGGNITLYPYPAVMFVTYFTRPDSQGEMRIQSADPDAAPMVDANHLSTELDRQKFVATFRWNRRLASQPALKPFVVEEAFPGPSLQTDEEILARAMELGGTCFHTAGTARMGVDEDAVVDPRLRVRGVEGLRVADTSIFPTLVSGNTNGPAMVTGLRAADFIIEDRKAG